MFSPRWKKEAKLLHKGSRKFLNYKRDLLEEAAAVRQAGQIVVDRIMQQALAKGFAQPLGIYDDITQARARRNVDLGGINLAFIFLSQHVFIGIDSCL